MQEEDYTSDSFRRVEVSYPALTQAAEELLGQSQSQRSNEDYLVMRELVGYLRRGTLVEVERQGDRLAYHFSARAGRSKAGAFRRFQAAHEAFGYQVVTEQDTVHIFQESNIMSATNNAPATATAPATVAPAPGIPTDAQMSQAFAAFSSATAKADKAASESAALAEQFKAAMQAAAETSAKAQETADAIRKEAQETMEAVRKEAAEALKAEQAKAAEQTKKATDAAERCAAMASAVLWYSELRKLVLRIWSRRRQTT